ncbi:MAG: Uma2 family endonuclease [Thermoguttaceae bacterium]
MSSIIHVTTAIYPESDGKPMGETDLHRNEIVRQIQLLERFFAGQRVYVSGDLLVFYEQGNPKKFVVPDVFVAKDLESKARPIYKVWFEGKPPDVILEVTSQKTKKKDTVAKPALYHQLRVPEYFLFDPTQDYLEPSLQGHRLVGEQYELLVPDAQGALVSEQLGLRLQAEGSQLMFYRLDTGERLLTAADSLRTAEVSLRTAEESLQSEAAARRAAEAEVARLYEELRRRDGT